MDSQASGTLLKMSAGVIAAAAVAVGSKSDDKTVKAVAGGTAMVAGALAVVTGAFTLDDATNAVSDIL